MKRVDLKRERNLNWSFSWKRVQKLSVLTGIFWKIKDFLIKKKFVWGGINVLFSFQGIK